MPNFVLIGKEVFSAATPRKVPFPILFERLLQQFCPFYHKIFISDFLERWLIYDCENQCSFDYLILVAVLHKFNHAIFKDSSFNRSRDMDSMGLQNVKSRSRDPVPTTFDIILDFVH